MTTPKRDRTAGRAFAMPVLMILGLLAIHWAVSDWSALPRLISSTLAAIH